jgi:hypothetical protein
MLGKLSLGFFSLDIYTLAILLGFVILDLVFRLIVYKDLDSIAADVIIFAVVKFLYDIFRIYVGPETPPIPQNIVWRLVGLLILAGLFATYHGNFLLDLCKEKIRDDFSELISKIRIEMGRPGNSPSAIAAYDRKIHRLNMTCNYALKVSQVNISKGYLGKKNGNSFKEKARYQLKMLVHSIDSNIFSQIADPDNNIFLLDSKIRMRHCVLCFLFGLAAVLISAIVK